LRLRRFGIVGDIHAEHEMLASVLDHLSKQGIEAVLAVGDIVDGPGSVAECCRMLAAASALVVRGNHDRWFLEGKFRDLPGATLDGDVDVSARAFLASLPPTRRLHTVRGDLLLCHGTGEDDMSAVGPEDELLVSAAAVELLVCGHSHRRMVRRIGPLTIINAGTLSTHDEPGFGIVDLDDEPQVTFFECIADRVIVTTDVVRLPLAPA
jgi:predicted phosphodiesterase